MTSAYALINVQGPKSRELLSRVTHADLSNEAFPYMTPLQKGNLTLSESAKI
jgi:4-methylaminobutanoate oxidase (formaldehyde-forming)